MTLEEKTDPEFAKAAREAIFHVNATSCERHFLWCEHSSSWSEGRYRDVEWSGKGSSGYLITIGHIGEHPVCVDISLATIAGKDGAVLSHDQPDGRLHHGREMVRRHPAGAEDKIRSVWPLQRDELCSLHPRRHQMIDIWDEGRRRIMDLLKDHPERQAELDAKWAAVDGLIAAPLCLDGRLIHDDEDIGECSSCEGCGCGPLQNCPEGGGCGCDPPYCMAKNGRGSRSKYSRRDEGSDG